jgi:hypothetical protein
MNNRKKELNSQFNLDIELSDVKMFNENMHTHAYTCYKRQQICVGINQITGKTFFYCATALSEPGSLHYRGFTITLRHTTLGRTALEERSALRIDLYLKTHNTQR